MAIIIPGWVRRFFGGLWAGSRQREQRRQSLDRVSASLTEGLNAAVAANQRASWENERVRQLLEDVLRDARGQIERAN